MRVMRLHALAEALYVSPAATCAELTGPEIDELVREAICCYTLAGCAERLAADFGDYRDTAPARMRWANEVVAATHPAPHPRPPVLHVHPLPAATPQRVLAGR